MSPDKKSTEKTPATPATWDQLQQKFEELRNSRKRIAYNIDGLVAEFVIRELTQAEVDEIDAATVKVRTERRGTEMDFDTGAGKDLYIQRGVAEGPPGWNGTERDIRSLPAWVREDLADKVQKWSTLDAETAIGFRGPRKG